MAYSAGTFTIEPAKKSNKDGAPQISKKKFTRFIVKSTTANEWVGEIWVAKATIVTEGADPATVTVA